MSRRHADDGQTESWRVKVDDDISGLSKKMAGVESVLSSVVHSIDSLSRKFDKSQSSGKTQWPVLISSAGLLLLIMGGFLGGYVRDLTRVETHTNKNSDNLVSHKTGDDPHKVGQLFDAKLIDFRAGLRNELNTKIQHQKYVHGELHRRLELIELRQHETRRGAD